MQEQTTASLTTVFSEVLANLAFMFMEDEQVDTPTGEQWLETVIGTCGNCGGDVVKAPRSQAARCKTCGAQPKKKPIEMEAQPQREQRLLEG